MNEGYWHMWEAVVLVILFLAIYIAVSSLLLYLWPNRRIDPLRRIRLMLAQERKLRWYRRLRLLPKQSSQLEELRSLLTACGLQVDAADYAVVRRLLSAAVILVAAAAYLAWEQRWLAGSVLYIVWIIGGAAAALLACDQMILRGMRERRRARIVQDLQAISLQLLYYRQSSLNIHSQLQRCVPLAVHIRKEMQLLVNEWYEGSGEAIAKFRRRLTVEEADDFAETLNALRLHGSERYYDLLEERARSYKEKLALIREGRREAASYVLFLIAGIPILYTFLIFIYPWVAESRYLFSTLY